MKIRLVLKATNLTALFKQPMSSYFIHRSEDIANSQSKALTKFKIKFSLGKKHKIRCLLCPQNR